MWTRSILRIVYDIGMACRKAEDARSRQFYANMIDFIQFMADKEEAGEVGAMYMDTTLTPQPAAAIASIADGRPTEEDMEEEEDPEGNLDRQAEEAGSAAAGLDEEAANEQGPSWRTAYETMCEVEGKFGNDSMAYELERFLRRQCHANAQVGYTCRCTTHVPR